MPVMADPPSAALKGFSCTSFSAFLRQRLSFRPAAPTDTDPPPTRGATWCPPLVAGSCVGCGLSLVVRVADLSSPSGRLSECVTIRGPAPFRPVRLAGGRDFCVCVKRKRCGFNAERGVIVPSTTRFFEETVDLASNRETIGSLQMFLLFLLRNNKRGVPVQVIHKHSSQSPRCLP